MNSNWFLYNKKKNIKEISQKFGISNLTSVILCNRDIFDDKDIKMILSDDLRDMNDEKLLPDIDMAIEILHNCIINGNNIRIVGDYDIDGVCSTYILYDSIKRLNGIVSYSIPDRVVDGYGINDAIIDKAITDKIDLLITCDNGISAEEQIKYANENGIKVIVTDHHDVGELPKSALAIVNPKRNDANVNYPFSGISGGAVAWKLMARYYDVYKNDRDFIINNYLDFAMLSTIGDIMPLVNENHIIAKLGLKSIVNTKNKGLKKLLDISGIDYINKGMNSYSIGYIIGPLINAAGRMNSATLALKLFISDDDDEIDEIANTLKSLNDDRKKITEDGYKNAVSLIEKEYSDDKVIVIFVSNLEEQVAGIVAGRLKEKYFKPIIVLTDTFGEALAKASCRSIEAYDIYEALCRHKDMFLKFGGHKLAAGFSIKKDDIDELRRKLNSECQLKNEDFIPKVRIDAEYPFYVFDFALMGELENLEPFGQSFSKPQFATRKVKAQVKNVYGVNKNVVHLSIAKDGNVKKGVAFTDSNSLINVINEKGEIDIVYSPKINDFKGNKSIEININEYR